MAEADLIDGANERTRLREQLDAAGTDVAREDALAVFRRHLAQVQADVRSHFEAYRLSGAAAARALSDGMDGLIAELVAYTVRVQVPDAAETTFAVAATGGYGRGTLAPFSDIDLLFLTEEEAGGAVRAVVEFVLYFLWDLGLKVGHATRSIAECVAEAEEDVTIRTSLVDTRLLAGDPTLFGVVSARLIVASVESGAAGFIAAKQAERHARHARYGESAFLVEPNIKEGRGGLRDMQTLYWMSRTVFGNVRMRDLVAESGEAKPGAGLLTDREARLSRRSWDFLWTVRFHLHYVAGRAEERLTFDMQPVVGARMGYTHHGRQVGVERFMRHYFLTAREVMRLTHVLEPQLARAARGAPALTPVADAALTEAGYTLLEGELVPIAIDRFTKDPLAMLEILRFARDRGAKMHPLAMHLLIRFERGAVRLRDDARANEILLDLLCGQLDQPRTDGARMLGILNETGLLGRLVPDWSRIVGQMQFDTYHVYTVDEHTIEAVRVLNALEAGKLAEVTPVASELATELSLDPRSRRALYVAMLLHDIAKGRGGDHSELGAEVAQGLGPRLGLSAEETETVSWLVLHHLLLSTVAFKRDIDDPKTILDLADTIQSPARLRLLLMLTVADMRAVSPRVWNNWKATLLTELYTRVADVLEGGLATTERDVRVARAKEAAGEALADDGWDEVDRAMFLGLGYGSYWLAFDPDTHVRHARLVREAERSGAALTVEALPLPARAVTEVTVYATDHAGLFSRIAGALAIAGASIVDARIHTLVNGRALDTFWVQDAADGTFDEPRRLAKLPGLIERAVSGELGLTAAIDGGQSTVIGRRMRAIHVPPRVVVDNRASNTHTVIEVNGRDRPGLLHEVTDAISQQGLQIASAHVTTYGVRAVDVFYVKDVFGLKVTNERKLALLREAVLGVLASPDASAAA
jgi:[protein-PII] uridylyltransferase